MHPKGRRLAALRALGGYKSQAALADALKLTNFGGRTIRDVEAGRRQLHDHERDAVARLVKVSPDFFEVDLAALSVESEPGAAGSPTNSTALTPEAARAALLQLLDLAAQVGDQAAEGTPSPPGDTDHPGEDEEDDAA
jgi:hypothetical protein